MSQPPNIIGAIEIGTAKVVAVVGEIIEGPRLNIIGVGQAPSQGIKKAEVFDFNAANSATHAAIMAAEQSAGVNFQNVFLAQSGSYIEGFFNEGSVNVSSSDNHVREEDINRVTQEAKGKQLPPERVYIHHIQNPFKLDGHIVSNPLGMQGKKLQVGYWSVHANVNKLRDHIHIINGFGLRVEDVIISSIASGAMVTDETEKHNGALIIDIGRGTTDFALYHQGYIVQTGVLPIGGDHLTNDIALGLRIDSAQAERIKKEHGSATFEENSTQKILIQAEDTQAKRSIYRTALNQIINARVDELFNIIKASVDNITPVSKLAAGVILTGGSSRLPDVSKVAQTVFGTNVRLGENPSWAFENLRDPEYCTVLGLLHYALRSKEKHASFVVKKQGLFTKVAKILNLS